MEGQSRSASARGLGAGPDGAAMAEVERLLRASIGLEPTAVGKGWTRLRVRERLEVTGAADLTAYLELLRADRSELEVLAERMAVPETWFFRDLHPFLALARHAVGAWASAHPSRRLRVLSLPCASGEEPYSVVMALLDAGFPRERLRVDGVDLRQEALDRAERGVYGSYSFRGVAGGFRSRYFTETEAGAELDPEVKEVVRFSRANVLDEGLAERLMPYDVVLCRNLMVYLGREARGALRRVVARLTLPDGILVAGKAESSLLWEPEFVALPPVSACTYRRVVEAGRRAAPSPIRPTHARAALPVSPAAVVSASPPGAGIAHRSASAEGQDVLARARSLADHGDLDAAERECRRVVSEQGPSVALLVLMAALASARGEHDQVETHLGRALYLDPRNREALALLAVNRRRRGDLEGERRLRARLQRVTASTAERAS